MLSSIQKKIAYFFDKSFMEINIGKIKERYKIYGEKKYL